MRGLAEEAAADAVAHGDEVRASAIQDLGHLEVVGDHGGDLSLVALHLLQRSNRQLGHAPPWYRAVGSMCPLRGAGGGGRILIGEGFASRPVGSLEPVRTPLPV